MRYLIPFLLICLITPVAYGQEKPLTCLFSSGNLAGQEIFARQEWNTHRLSLLSWNTSNIVMELEANFAVNTFDVISWSPECRYLLGEVGTDAGLQVFAWNTATGSRVGVLDGSTQKHRLNWSPDSRYLVIQLKEGAYLWDLVTNQQTLLNSQIDTFGRSLYSVEWDVARNQLLVVQIGSGNGVTAYDLSSGQHVAFFHIGERATPVSYRRLDDNRYMLVYTSGQENWHDGKPEGLALWDRHTLQSLQLDPNYEFFAPTGDGGFDVIGNLYSHYFILSDYGIDFGRLYVWDLQNLIGESPYTPNFYMPLGLRGNIRLLGENTLEVAEWEREYWGNAYPRIRATVIDLVAKQIQYQHITLLSDCEGAIPAEFTWTCEVAAREMSDSESRTGVNNGTYWKRD